MRPIFWGSIWFLIGMDGWGLFGVLYVGPVAHVMSYLFAIVFLFSLPIAVVAEIVRWYRRRKQITAPMTGPMMGPMTAPMTAPEAEPSRFRPARAVMYCGQCGTQMPTGSTYCKQCGTRV